MTMPLGLSSGEQAIFEDRRGIILELPEQEPDASQPLERDDTPSRVSETARTVGSTAAAATMICEGVGGARYYTQPV